LLGFALVAEQRRYFTIVDVSCEYLYTTGQLIVISVIAMRWPPASSISHGCSPPSHDTA
jgi:hypothetical protein